MLIAVVKFGRARVRGDAEGAVYGYLANLRRNGQVGDFLVSNATDGWMAVCSVPRADSWEKRHDSAWVLADRELLAIRFGRAPRWRLLGSPLPATSSALSARRLLLYATWGDSQMPMRDFDSGAGVPLYKLPIDQVQRQAIGAWAHEYATLDDVWMASGALEKAAYRQLASLDSELTRTGRRLARDLERALGKPTYYYLLRYHGRARGEARRRCSGCGGAWARRRHGNHRFEFRCDRCRLVSHCGSDYGEPAMARIGEWRAR